MKTIVGLYVQPDGADNAVKALETAGFAESSIQTVRSVAAMWQNVGCTPGKLLLMDTAVGAALGIGLYAIFGALAAFAQLSLGFEGATALAAFLLAGAAGAAVGGGLGLIFGLGIMEQEGRLFTAGIRAGGVLVVVRTSDEHAARALDLLRQTGGEGVRICKRSSDRPPHKMGRAAPA